MSDYRDLLASMPASEAEAIRAGKTFLGAAAEYQRTYGVRPPIQGGDVVRFIDTGESRTVARAIPSDRGRTVTLELEAR